MPKLKKTRKQKIMADRRRETNSTTLYSFTSQRLTEQPKQTILSKTAGTISTSSYQYLSGDLRKTLLFTGFVVLAELALYFFL